MFKFAIEFDYQHALQSNTDSVLLCEMHLAKTLLYLLRAWDAENIRYLVQRYSEYPTRDLLCNKLDGIFVDGWPWHPSFK